jgi:hypothetical protein
MPVKKAKNRPWTKDQQRPRGGNKSVNGRGKAKAKVPRHDSGENGGAWPALRGAAKRPASTGKANATRSRNPSSHETKGTPRHNIQGWSPRNNGETDSTQGAPDGGTVLSTNVRAGALARVGYAAVYGVSFGAAFPVWLMCAIFGSVARA